MEIGRGRTLVLRARALAPVMLAALAVVPSCGDAEDDPGGQPQGLAETSAHAVAASLRRDHPRLFGRRGTAVHLAGGQLEPTCDDGCTAVVAAPAVASGASTVLDRRTGVGARFALQGTVAVEGVIDGDLVVYPGALRTGGPADADVLVRLAGHGAEDFVRLLERPEVAELRYTVWPVAAAGVRQIAQIVEILDAGGAPRVRVAPPWVEDATGRRFAASLAVEGCAVDRDVRVPWSRPVTPLDAASCELVVTWPDAAVTYPLLVDPQWIETGNMVEARSHHTASVLPGVGVLLAGGFDDDGVALASAEIGCLPDDCAFPVFTATGPMAVARGDHGQAELDGDRVLVTGGRTHLEGDPDSARLASAEIYDVEEAEFTTVDAMSAPRAGHTTTRMETTGDVLVAGGDDADPTTGEVFDAGSGTFGPPRPMATQRELHAAESLDDGRVLLVGGRSGVFATSSAEIFDPDADAFQALPANMTSVRIAPTATRLDDGTVLITGGTNGTLYYATIDIFDPEASAGDLFEQEEATMDEPRAFHRATKLLGTPGVPGRVLLTGGMNATGILGVSEVFDVDLGDFGFEEAMNRPRAFHTATRLATGQVLVTGGEGADEITDEPSSFSTEVQLRDDGEPCADAAECGGGFCPGAPDGVCCTSACEESCETCVTGECQVVPDDTTVKPVCTDDVELLLVCVDGEVSAGEINPCSPFACAGETCGTACESDDGCSATGFCDNEICVTKRAIGEGCAEDRECGGGFCADGVCCNTRCDRRCEACDLQGAVGICQQNDGPPRPGREACDGEGGPCAGTCGTDLDECDYPEATCSDGSCAEGQLTVGRCHVEAPGVCTTTTETCGTFACLTTGDACASSCASVTDCAPGHACRPDGQCVLVEQAECDGDAILVSPDGTTRDCAPFRCSAGICLDRCTSVDDCVAPSVCDEQGACVEAPGDPPPPEGCAVGDDRGSGTPWPLAVLILAALHAARRRTEARS